MWNVKEKQNDRIFKTQLHWFFSSPSIIIKNIILSSVFMWNETFDNFIFIPFDPIYISSVFGYFH